MLHSCPGLSFRYPSPASMRVLLYSMLTLSGDLLQERREFSTHFSLASLSRPTW